MAECVNCRNLLRTIDELMAVRNTNAERHEKARIIAEQERLDVLRSARANRSRWKNARRDFLAVRAERDDLWARLVAVEREREKLADSEQGWVDRACYNRNVAVAAGAEPEAFDNEYDQALARGECPSTELEAHQGRLLIEAEAVMRESAWQFNEAVSLLREARGYVAEATGCADDIDDELPAIQSALEALAQAVTRAAPSEEPVP